MPSNTKPRAELRVNALLLSIALGLAACGGGGGGDGGSAGGPAASAPAPAPVQAAAIATQPLPQAVDTGASATFTVSATGSGLAYQWKRDGKDIAGATAASYKLDNVQAGDDGAVFTVEVKNSLGSVVSAGATLRVAAARGLSLLAGRFGGRGTLDGQDARFENIAGLAVGPAGAVLVSEASGLGGRLRSVDPSTGNVSTVMAYPDRTFANLIEFDAAGNRYEMAGLALYKTTPAGARTLVAGTDAVVRQPVAVDGPGVQARFQWVHDMAFDGAGNLYVADDARIRKIDPAGTVTTLAGSARADSPVDGSGAKATFRKAAKLVVDKTGNLIVLDVGFSFQPALLRKVAPDGTVTTLALKAGDQAGPVDSFGESGGGLAIDQAGNVYVGDASKGCRIRRIAPDGIVTTLAGSATAVGNVDGKGEAARFCSFPGGSMNRLEIDRAGNLYLSDGGNYTLRRVTPAGEVTTVAGRAGAPANTDGQGASAAFAPSFPGLRLPYFYYAYVPVYSLVTDAQGNAYLGEGDRIRKVTAAGAVSTLAPAPQADADTRYYPGSLGSGGTGLVLQNNVISRVDANGNVQFLAGRPGIWQGASDGTGAGAAFESPYDLVVDGLGNIFLHDVIFVNGIREILQVVERKISPDGVVTTLPAPSTDSPILAWHPDREGGVWAARRDGSVLRIGADGTRKVVLPAGDRYPTAMTRDAAGNLYLATKHVANPVDDWGHWFTIRKIAPDGKETILAGAEGLAGVRLGNPGSVGWVDALAIGPDGILYVMTENALLKLRP